MMGLLVPVTGDIEHKDFPDLRSINEAVGGYIEGVGAPPNRDDVVVYANEEGLIYGLPLNMRISRWVGMPIVGAVVILGFDGSPDETDVPLDVKAEIE